MKKAIIIIGIIFLIVAGSLIAIPVLFKDALLEKTKTTLRNKLGVEVEFSDFNLSLFRNFPKASLELKNVFVSGTNPFQNDTLLFIPEFSSEMSLASLFNKAGATIEKLEMKSPLLKLLVNQEGLANWDFAQGGVPETVNDDISSAKEEKAFQLGLEGVTITGANVLYLDKSSGVTLNFNNTDLNLSGKMYGSTTNLDVWSKVGNFVVMYDSLAYISNTTLETNTVLNVDYEKMQFGIKENELLINRLPLVVNGEVSVPNDTIQFNLDIKSAKTGLEEFLALVPPEYESYLNGLTAKGNATMAGSVKGYFYEEQYPALNFAFKIGEGSLKYEGLPEEVGNITADVSISKPQGSLNSMAVKIRQAHTEVKNNPVDLTLSITNLFGDPYFDGGLVGKINFDHLKDALPLDSVNMAGEIDANVFIKASYSDIMEEKYNQIKSDGIVYLSGFTYADPKLSRALHVPNGQLNFSPSFVELSEMDVRIGQSDMRLAGKVSNYLGYFLGDGILKGNLSLNSQVVNLNELMNLQVEDEVKNAESAPVAEAQKEEPGESLAAFDIPENIDLQFTSNISNVIFGSLPVTNVDGLITARNGKLVLEGLKCHMFQGLVTLTGSYANNKENMPAFDFGFNVSEIDLPTASRSVSSLHELMPQGSKSQGKISTRFSASGRLSPELKIIPASVDGSGLFNTNNIQIIDSPTFAQLKNLLKQEKLKNITVDNFTANFIVTDGNLQLRPFKTKIAGQQTAIEGNLNVEDILNLKMDFVVERSAFGPDIQELLGALPGQEKITAVPVTVMLTGPVNNPEVKMDYTDTRKYITEKVKESASDGLKRIGNALKKLIDQ